MKNLFYILIILIHKCTSEATKYGTCYNGNILPGPTKRPELDCMPREQLVKLNLPNQSYAYVTPDHVFVSRCGGSCNLIER